MGKPKGKTPSLLTMSTGKPAEHTCGKATKCDRCSEKIAMGSPCFQIPKMKSGFTVRPIFCVGCTIEIVEQTKSELGLVEETVRNRA